MTKTKSTPEASAEGAQEHAISTARDLLGDVLGAIILAVKFPLTPVPPNIVSQMDEALAAFRACGVESNASIASAGYFVGTSPGEVFERLSRLEAFADRLTEELPAQLKQIQDAIEVLEASAKSEKAASVADPQTDPQGEKK